MITTMGTWVSLAWCRGPVGSVLGTGRAIVCVFTFVAAGCGGESTPTQPSPMPVPAPAPGTSTLTFQVEAGQANAAFSRSYTTDTATFGAGVNPSCVSNPTLGTYCPGMLARVTPISSGPDSEMCSFTITAPVGQQLRPATYRATGSQAGAEAQFSVNCSRAGTACGVNSTAQFTLHEMATASSGVVTRLHVTWEQSCLSGTPPTTGFYGKMTGELWIVNGTNPFGAAGY